jgi:hypothetical protein
MAKDESNAEKQVRLRHEQECRRIADLVRAELPEDRGFILMTMQRGPAGSDFASTDYVATIHPKDALRLLREHIGRLTARTGIVGEPTEETATVLREHVHALLEDLEQDEPPPSPNKVWQGFCRARSGVGTYRQRSAAFTALGVVAMLELEYLQRSMRRTASTVPPSHERQRPEASAAAFDALADQAAEELRRHVRPPEPGTSRGDTKTTLVADLERKPPSEAREHLITLARGGFFHDYDSPSATPKVDLHDALAAVGYEDLAQKVINGAYDDERPTVEQEEEMRQDFGPAAFDAIMGNKPRGSA